MNFKALIKIFVFMISLVSIQTFAGVSQEFRTNCERTTARIVEGVKLTQYFADANVNRKGIYVVSSTGGVWIIPGAQNYPDNYVADEMRKIAMAAILSDMKVNLCASEAYSPNHIWAIELDAE
ncbi:Heat-labile enterotoxin IIA, B chain [Escherichia sp. E4702]|uniref:Heat-labile enterotoxin IIA, B chain n=1 Tax=Escherichia sp. E4702 TaxID=2044465 RepID=UPI001081D5DD|nr:Heat-labile enterotoxin IIA, B chain [Escherichia sp. E4702]TGB73052.1 Heat-labile enterotoxin IIA, B chain [Escherichia sp. E4702]